MAAARQIRQLYDARFAELNLNLSQASILAYVTEFGAKTQTELAGRMGLGRAATGTVIDQLEARGLLQRHPDPEDRRVWMIDATIDGRNLVDQVTDIDTIVREQLRVGISRSERQELASLLVRIQQNLACCFDQQNTNGEAAADGRPTIKTKTENPNIS